MLLNTSSQLYIHKLALVSMSQERIAIPEWLSNTPIMYMYVIHQCYTGGESAQHLHLIFTFSRRTMRNMNSNEDPNWSSFISYHSCPLHAGTCRMVCRRVAAVWPLLCRCGRCRPMKIAGGRERSRDRRRRGTRSPAEAPAPWLSMHSPGLV